MISLASKEILSFLKRYMYIRDKEI